MKYTVWENDVDGNRKFAEFDSLEKARECVMSNRSRGFNVYARDESGETVCPSYKRDTRTLSDLYAKPFLSH